MPQPVDLQTEVARVTAAERIQQIADRASLAAQQRAAAEVEGERVENEQQVQQTPQTESRQVDADEHRKNPFMGRRRRKGSGKDPDQEEAGGLYNADERPEPLEGCEGQQLDVTI
ncbi:MAG: hypothetical protein JXR94_04045 [Candidatus Hydrogenedentes bacterium]|nr:hypothetical protein [Candidatus Hydrogenedentota bacterium]